MVWSTVRALAVLALLGTAGQVPSIGASSASASTFARGPHDHWLGESFGSLPLTYHGRGSFIYGDCDSSDGGCVPPLEVQNHSICERNPLEIDIVPSSISRTRGAIIVAYSRDRHEVLTGSTNAVIFDDGSMFNEALRQLRPYPDDSVSSRRLHAARLPRWVLRELKLVMQVHARLGSGPAARKKLGISSSAILGRLRLAHAVGAAALRHVEASRFTPGEVIADRQAYIDTREGFPPQDTAGRRRAQRHAARIKAC